MKTNIEFYIFKVIKILNFSINNFDFWNTFQKKQTSGAIRKK